MLRTLHVPLALTALAAPLLAADHVVDAGGSPGSFASIAQAMAAALPGDRILVLPGAYPAFQFSRGVEVIGMGASPADVRVDRVDFHVSIPTFGYDAVLENLTVCSPSPSDTTSIAGNELALGTFVLHRVETCGGVFLNGAEVYVLAQDCRFEPPPGGGFLGAAFDLRGTLDLVDSQVLASDATGSIPAGLGLRVAAGSQARLTRSEVRGGAGSLQLPAGGDGVVGGLDARLRLAGASVVRGGDAAPYGGGGAGIALTGRIELGDAAVLGGAGSPPGAAYEEHGPLPLEYDPELGASWLGPDLELAIDGSVASLPALLGHATGIDAPAPARPLLLLDAHARYSPTHQLWLRGLGTWGAAGGHGRGRAFFQGTFRDPLSGALVTTNPIVLHLGG